MCAIFSAMSPKKSLIASWTCGDLTSINATRAASRSRSRRVGARRAAMNPSRFDWNKGAALLSICCMNSSIALVRLLPFPMSK
jgi:hypothetical protein